MRNVSYFDMLMSQVEIKPLIFKFRELYRIIKLFPNWPDIILVAIGLKAIVKVSIKEGEQITIHSLKDMRKLIYENPYYKIAVMPSRFKIGIGKYDIIFNYNKKQLHLYHGGNRKEINHAIGAISEIFCDNIYDKLDVKNKDVVDIGANIGDSALYFATKQSKRVLAFEPYKNNLSIMSRSMLLNKIKNVVIINQAVADKIKTVKLPENGTFSSTINAKGKIPVEVTTLKSIVTNYNILNGVLKLDCEGSEYDIILSQQSSVLRKFNQMIIEYHYGYKNLEKKLKIAGFKTIHTRPLHTQNMDIGLLFAQKIA